MRRLILVLFIVFGLSGLLLAQTEPLSVSFTPDQISLNVLNAAAFDPIYPENQPILTNLRIVNVSSDPVYFGLNLIIKWNNSANSLVDITFNSSKAIQPGAANAWNLSNRELVTHLDSDNFGFPSENITIEDVMNGNPILKSALESGNFPDGKLSFQVILTPVDRKLRTSQASCIISVKNITSVFLTYPGKPVGQTPPKVDMKPVTFLWNAMTTNINTFHITIKEYLPGMPPNANSVENTGRMVVDKDVGNNMFDEFLPFQNNHYYAWQIKTPLFTESNFPGSGNPSGSSLKSQWNIFQFNDSQGGADTDNMQITAILNMFRDPAIIALIQAGFMPTGVVIFEGQVYTGQDAIDLVKTLLGKTLDVKIKEQ